ncbi:hypothetical protein ACHAXT_009057 [Thalassiosira profunda]
MSADWTRGVVVQCTDHEANGPYQYQYLRLADIEPIRIASIEDRYGVETGQYTDEDWKAMGTGGTGMSVMTARSLKEVLNRTKIHSLNVSWNNIKDEGLEVILSAQHAKHLVKLHVDGCKFTTRGFETLAQFIRRDDIELKLLAVDIESRRGRRSDLVSESDATRWRQMLADAIPKSSTLEAVTLAKSYGLRAEFCDTLLNLVCDTSNLEALISSNHRMCSLETDYSRYYLPFRTESHPALTKAFEINLEAHRRAEKEAGADRNGIIANAIRRKVRNIYLAKKDFDLQCFNDMDVLLMPRLIHLVLFKEPDDNDRRIYWQSGDGPPLIPREDLNSIYRLLRNCHVAEVFSFKSPEKLLSERDKKIEKLERANAELKTEKESVKEENETLKEENETLKAEEKSRKQRIEELERENEALRSAGSGRPSKRAKTDDVESRLAASESRHAASEGRLADVESRLAALEANARR